MIVSPEKLADIKEREECLLAMEQCLKLGEVDLAKKYGELSEYYAERIKKDDYKDLDKKWALYHKLQ